MDALLVARAIHIIYGRARLTAQEYMEYPLWRMAL